jgi:hypothetical protein
MTSATDDLKQRQLEYRHHGDSLVPRQQRFSTYGRDLLNALNLPVINQWGLRPAAKEPQRAGARGCQPRPRRAWSAQERVEHELSPAPALLRADCARYQGRARIARQPVDLDRPHPFTAAGNKEFNCQLWAPPQGERAGDVLVADSTHFTTLFGETESLLNFWRNFAAM